MTNRLLAVAAATVALAAYPVFAQTSGSQPTTPSQTSPSPSTPSSPPQPGATPSTPTSPGSSSGTSTGTTGTTSPPASDTTTGRTTQATPPRGQTGSAGGSVSYYTHQSGDLRASRIIGQSVRNSQGEQIGDVNDLVVDTGGQIKAVVIGVGGFLGLGEREVAVSMQSLQMQPPGAGGTTGTGGSGGQASGSSSQPTMVLNATRDTLKDAPRWSWGDQATGTGTGAGSGGTSGGTGSGSRQ